MDGLEGGEMDRWVGGLMDEWVGGWIGGWMDRSAEMVVWSVLRCEDAMSCFLATTRALAYGQRKSEESNY